VECAPCAKTAAALGGDAKAATAWRQPFSARPALGLLLDRTTETDTWIWVREQKLLFEIVLLGLPPS
jgi:hypothetical protein